MDQSDSYFKASTQQRERIRREQVACVVTLLGSWRMKYKLAAEAAASLGLRLGKPQLVENLSLSVAGGSVPQTITQLYRGHARVLIKRPDIQGLPTISYIAALASQISLLVLF
ncbi:hypothetical protein ACLH0K_13675 [Arthrobacter sp. MPF02]|uniref:hypothetical protein n=1 Tax=Arthrobacter sp. MPF02 TaxID=3388492 RepID=UPI003984853B